MNDPFDDLLDARLRDETPYLDDAGFTTRVMQQLPAQPSTVRSQRSFVIFFAALVSVVVAYFASGQAWFLRESMVNAAKMPPLMALACAVAVGMLFTVGGLWAALNRTRDPLW